MTHHQLSTKEKKNIVDTQTLTKDGKWIKYSETYRWGYVSFDSDEAEDFDADAFDLQNDDGFDVGSLPIDSREFNDCVANDFQFSENIDAKDIAKYKAIFDKDGFEELSNFLFKEGWSDDYETMFYGPLELIED